MAVPYSDVSPYASNRLYYNGGEATYDRALLGMASLGTINQDLRMTNFVALRTETCNNITTYSIGAAAATPTLCRLGVYEQDTSGNLTLLAATVNDTTLWNATNTRYVRPLNTPFNKVAGHWYALGWLVVTSFTVPSVSGCTNSNFPHLNVPEGQVPWSGFRIQALSDLPTFIPVASITTPLTPSFMEVLP